MGCRTLQVEAISRSTAGPIQYVVFVCFNTSILSWRVGEAARDLYDCAVAFVPVSHRLCCLFHSTRACASAQGPVMFVVHKQWHWAAKGYCFLFFGHPSVSLLFRVERLVGGLAHDPLPLYNERSVTPVVVEMAKFLFCVVTNHHPL